MWGAFMSESTTTRSVFSIDSNPFSNTGFTVDPNKFHTIFVDQDTYYFLQQSDCPSVTDGQAQLYSSWSFGEYSIYRYDPQLLTWTQYEATAGAYYISADSIISQDWDSSRSDYFSSSQFSTWDLPAPLGSRFDAIYVNTPLDEVLALLPVVLLVLIAFIGTRKSISFIRSILSRG